ncbi:MAG: 16S rRNA (uracil(1498)-N(3))-methyltransferase [Clostridia bacterium]|nr:16S rRNA (uracil(1498)-N(3))-methyltransferase [Clostridia bacterium]
MRRFFTEPQNISENSATIYEDATHITKVLRMKSGDKILIFDGTGYEYTCELLSVTKDRCEAKILSSKFSEQEPETRVTIYQGIPKSGKMEGIIQKSVELGVHSIVPVAMDRCVSKLEAGKKQDDKISRWNKVAVEAAKQCGRGIIPKVEAPMNFADAIDRMSKTQLAIMPYEMLAGSTSNLKEALSESSATEISVIIGPEGGFSESEAALAEKSGIKLVGLGPRILRTETVSSAILAIIMYQNNEM